MYSRALVFIVLSSLSTFLAAEGLYLQTLKQTEPTEEQLQKSLKTVDEYKKIQLRGELEVPPFHKRTAQDDSLDNSFCSTCHLSPPHTKSIRSRTFMNMHTQYIACESCHFRPENVQLKYQWQDTRDGTVVAAKTVFFRQTIKLDKTQKAEMIAAEKPKNTFLKITPYYQQQAVNLRKDSDFAKQTKSIWQQTKMTPEKVERRALIHAPLTEKGPKCQACHTDKDALLDLAVLGADSYQAAKIQNNIVTQFFTRYKEDEQKIRIIDLLK